eukprot:992777-Prorocentrum_minimum.AAC.1
MLLKNDSPSHGGSVGEEEEYPAPEGGWARCEHHVEHLGPGAPRPCRRVSTTENWRLAAPAGDVDVPIW